MIDYLEHKVSPIDLIKIFKSNPDRSIFAWYYPHFGDDGNDVFYEEFIKRNIVEHRLAAQEDAIEMSIALCFFEPSFLIEIKKILHSRRGWLIKLTALDWLSFFYKKISADEFIEINQYVLKYAADEILKVQSILNILLVRDDIQIIDNLMLCLAEAGLPAVFYRFMNNLDTGYLAKKFTNEMINAVQEIVLSKPEISKSQKVELVEKLSGLCL